MSNEHSYEKQASTSYFPLKIALVDLTGNQYQELIVHEPRDIPNATTFKVLECNTSILDQRI